MENASPYKRIQFKLTLSHCLPVNKKVKIKITSDTEEIIFNVLYLPKNLDVLHLCVYEFVESVDKFFTKLECKFIFTEVPQTLVEQPNVHIGY